MIRRGVWGRKMVLPDWSVNEGMAEGTIKWDESGRVMCGCGEVDEVLWRWWGGAPRR